MNNIKNSSSKYIKFWQLIGSIKLAVPLLTTIVSILVWATFSEARLGSEVIQQEVYKSWWFGVLMFLLSINLGASALLRYPWKGARKVGFALTHLGLVILIAGSAAVIHGSAEGLITLRVGGDPRDILRVQGDMLEVAANLEQVEQANILIHQDGHITPGVVGDLNLTGYSENSSTTIDFVPGATVPNPAVRLQFASDRMGQTIQQWLAIAPAAYRYRSLGPVDLEILQAKDAQELGQLLAVPEDLEQASPLGQVTLTTSQGEQIVELGPNIDEPIQVGDVTLEVIQVWRDFRLNENGQPINASDQLRNPALKVKLSQGANQEQWFVFANPDFPPIPSGSQGEPLEILPPTYQISAPMANNAIRIVLSPAGEVFYRIRSSQTWQTGNWTLGEAITPGWADFQITLTEVIPNAQPNRHIVPAANLGGETHPALQVTIGDGPDQWLPWGEPTELQNGSTSLFAAFMPRRLQLPFTIQLDNFRVDRNEGSDSIAMWTSSLSLADSTTGEQVHRDIWMNHPTWFRGWKLAQASWNPGDLQLSTIQVKREPWWMTALTSLGSCLVIAGIGTMFYGRTLLKRLSFLSPLSPKSLPQTPPPGTPPNRPESETVLS